MVGIKKHLLDLELEKAQGLRDFHNQRLDLQDEYTPSDADMAFTLDGWEVMSDYERTEWRRTIRINRMIEAGVCPIEYDKPTQCKNCGVVLTDIGGHCDWCPWCPTLGGWQTVAQ